MATLRYSRVLGGLGTGWTQVQLPGGRTLTVYGDRAVRNNNPGNLEYRDWQDAFGALGSDSRFAVFRTREDGIRAHAYLLFEKPKYRNLTLREAIAKYAPPNENNTAAYQNAVAAASGVSLDTKLSDVAVDKRIDVVDGDACCRGKYNRGGL